MALRPVKRTSVIRQMAKVPAFDAARSKSLAPDFERIERDLFVDIHVELYIYMYMYICAYLCANMYIIYTYMLICIYIYTCV